MRVIAGTAGGLKLKTIAGLATRPTQDRVREALFDILGPIAGTSWLDLFAGSGAVGIEALSRGAKTATFVEQNPRAQRIIVENLEWTKLENYRLLKLRAEKAIGLLKREGAKFDHIFLDPPYHKGLVPKTLTALADAKLLLPRGLVIAEVLQQEELPSQVGSFHLRRTAKYGQTALIFYDMM